MGVVGEASEVPLVLCDNFFEESCVDLVLLLVSSIAQPCNKSEHLKIANKTKNYFILLKIDFNCFPRTLLVHVLRISHH